MGPFSICVTVGTLSLQFDRLLRFLASVGLRDCSGLIQFGGSDAALLEPVRGNFNTQAFVPDKELDHAIVMSHVVIAHAGIGSIIKANSLKRPLVLLPRLEKYGEHFDDHQLQIVEVIRYIPGIFVSDDSADDFRQKVLKSLIAPPAVASALGGDELPQYLGSRVEKLQLRN